MDVADHENAARAVLDEMKGWEGGSRAPDHADYWTYKVCIYTYIYTHYIYIYTRDVHVRVCKSTYK